MTIGTVYESAKNGHWCTNRHMSKQTPPNTQSRANAATSRDLYHMCLGSGHSPSPVGRADYVSTWMSMRLAAACCYTLFYLLISDVVKAKISRPGQGQGLIPQGQGQGQCLDLRGQGQGHSPKAKAFKHTATTEIKICSTSDSLTG